MCNPPLMLYTARVVNKSEQPCLQKEMEKKSRLLIMTKRVDFGLIFHSEKHVVDTRRGPGAL